MKKRPGVFEGAIIVDDALSAGDKAALFKTFTKIRAQKYGKMACFMAKWSNDWPVNLDTYTSPSRTKMATLRSTTPMQNTT